MKIIKTVILFLLLINVTTSKGQINFQDSSAQVISYWDLGEKQEYSISLQKLKYSDEDTTSNETITYDVEISVIDSTADTYTVRWFYKNFNSDTQNPIEQKLMAITENIAVDIKLDELGVIKSVENWKEVKAYMEKAIDSLESDLNIPGMDKLFQQVRGMYATKEAIEASSIQDAQQFHNFHGGKYTLNEEIKGLLQSANLYDLNKPFDTEFSVLLEELDKENNQYIIRSIQEINSEQLTESTFNFLKKMAENLGQEFKERATFPDLKNIVETVSIIHNTGWVIESVLWKEVFVEGKTVMEIRKINLK